jgi:hypothetical protein
MPQPLRPVGIKARPVASKPTVAMPASYWNRMPIGRYPEIRQEADMVVRAAIDANAQLSRSANHYLRIPATKRSGIGSASKPPR